MVSCLPIRRISGYWSEESLSGQTALARGDGELARTLFEKVRPALESAVRDHPDEGGAHAPLGGCTAT
jgi:hypothetical protein